MAPVNFPRSAILVLGTNSVQSLLPATLISQVESLLESHRNADAVELADLQRKKLQGKARVEPDEANELCFVYQRIGFQCMRETLFEDAGKNLFVGELDPRILVSYFPDLRGTLFKADDNVELFAGVAEHMPPEASIDEIIAVNLVRNYSPHLPPSTREAPAAVELRQILRYAAEVMLEVFLRMWRFKLRSLDKGKQKANNISTVVDTALAKLYAKAQKTRELHAIIKEPNDVDLNDLEPILIECEQYSALCRLYEKRGEQDKLLDAWAKMVDGVWKENDTNAPNIDALGNMVALISEKRDRALTARWGVWLTKRDPERGFRLLISRDTNKRSSRTQTDEDVSLLTEIQQTSPEAAAQYLEYLVLQKRSSDRNLHMQLALSCLEQLRSSIAEDSVYKLWRAKASSYASNRSTTSFLSYFASTTPDSEHKRVRLKTILFLQGSTLYDPVAIRERLVAIDEARSKGKVLSLELAILEGKLSNHRHALSILVDDLNDATSAEAYCALGGDVVPAKTAHALGESCGLQLWAATLLPTASATKGASMLKRQKTVDERVKKDLLMVLLEVYMSGSEANADRTAHLLNSQAVNLDVLDVSAIVPDQWPLSAMSSFLSRSFRRALHAKHEAQIVKNISMSQNLEVSERTWLVVREQGAVIEEAADSESDEEGDANEKAIDEKGPGLIVVSGRNSGYGPPVSEKIGLHVDEEDLV